MTHFALLLTSPTVTYRQGLGTFGVHRWKQLPVATLLRRAARPLQLRQSGDGLFIDAQQRLRRRRATRRFSGALVVVVIAAGRQTVRRFILNRVHGAERRGDWRRHRRHAAAAASAAVGCTATVVHGANEVRRRPRSFVRTDTEQSRRPTPRRRRVAPLPRSLTDIGGLYFRLIISNESHLLLQLNVGNDWLVRDAFKGMGAQDEREGARHDEFQPSVHFQLRHAVLRAVPEHLVGGLFQLQPFFIEPANG